MKIYKLILFTLITLFTVVTNAQNIAFSDINFKNALLNNIVDTNFDGEISIAEAGSIHVRILNIDNSNITNLSGIEHFTSLDGLSAKNNDLESVDLSQNTMLSRLDLSSNNLSSIDLSQNTELTLLTLKQNQIEVIDLSNNINLESLYLSTNLLNVINVTNNTELTRLILDYNSLTSINVSNNSKLEILSLLTNELSFIDVSQNSELTELHVGNNNLDCINIQANLNLRRLDIRQNNFETLTIDNPTIELLDFRGNQNLQSAYLEGPQFQTAPYFGLSFINCTQLQNICVNAQYVQLIENLLIQPNYTPAVVSSNCNVTPPCNLITSCTDLVAIPDPNFEQALLDLNIDTDGLLNGTMCREDSLPVTFLSVGSKNINDLTGIEAFINLEYLWAIDNQVTTLELTQNIALKELYISNNELSAINLTQNIQLEYLDIRTNQFSTVDISQNVNLIDLYCSSNNLISLNVSTNTALKILHCHSNNLTDLDVNTNTLLFGLACSNNAITSLDVSNNPLLYGVNCAYNELTSIDFSANPLLNNVRCHDNEIINLDFSTNTVLEILECNSNKLKSLNLKNGNNTNIVYMTSSDNVDLSCILVDDVAYANSQGNWYKDLWTNYNEVFCPENIIPGPVTPIFCNLNEKYLTMQWGAELGVQGYQVEVTSSLQRRIMTYALPANQTSLKIKRYGDMSWRVRPIIDDEGIWSRWKRKCIELVLNPHLFSSRKTAKENIASSFVAYPNPVKKGDMLYVSNGKEAQSILIYNLTGQLVYQAKKSVQEIDTRDFQPGIYLIKIQTNQNVIMRNVIIK